MRRRLILCAAAFAVVEALAILYALWPSLTAKPHLKFNELRLGVVAVSPLGQAQEEWNSFASTFNKEYGCILRIYFANSAEEASSGLLNGSLDLLYTDAANFLELNGKAKLKPWFYHRLSKRERDRMRSILVCSKPVSYINDTKGLRLVLSGASSMTGNVVPVRYLEEKLPCKMQEWFSSIAVAPSEQSAIAMLLSGEADVTACCDLLLDQELMNSGNGQNSLRRIWLSMALPENIICSLESLPPDYALIMDKASERISSTKLREEFLTARSMVFLPPDHPFSASLQALQRFLEGPNLAKPKTQLAKPESK